VVVGLVELLRARTWRAFDCDDAGRVLAGWDDAGSVQLVELAPDGSPTVLTDLPGACSGRYLPGDRRVVVQHDDGGDERAQLCLLDPAAPGVLTPLVADPRFVHILLQVLPGRVLYRTNRRNGVDFDVLVANVASGAEEVLYDGGGLVAEAMLSPDSRYLALTVLSRQPMSTQLLLVDTLAATPDARLRELTDADEHARYENLHWLPDSCGVLLTTDRDSDHTFVARYELANDQLTVLVAAEHDVTAWSSPDGRSLLAETNLDGWSALALVDVESGGRREVRLPTPGVLAGSLPAPVFAPDSSTVALSVSAPGVPGDVLLLDVATASVRALTDTAVPGVAAPTSHVVPTPDGEQVPCYVYRPTVAATDLAGSSVTVVHGGPEGQSRPTFSPVVQALVAAGHTALVPNVRGSVGYGKRWYSLDDVGLRLDSVADLAAVHDWLPSLGLDPGRAALWGGSYGGYMVLAGCAFQPQRWAAGVDIVGISSLVTFLENTSAYRRAAREREYGTLADDREFLTRASPLSRIDDLRAPLVVIHGANDPRVPLTEAQQLHAALTQRGVPCELLVYPDEGHGLANRANREDAYPRALDFLARQLGSALG